MYIFLDSLNSSHFILCRLLLQGDIRKMTEEDNSEPLAAPRNAWGNIPFQPRILPLEVTASAMEGRDPVPAYQSWDLGYCVIFAGLVSLTFSYRKKRENLTWLWMFWF